MFQVTLRIRPNQDGKYLARIHGELMEFAVETARYFVKSTNFNDALHSFDTHNIISCEILFSRLEEEDSPNEFPRWGLFIPLGFGPVHHTSLNKEEGSK